MGVLCTVWGKPSHVFEYLHRGSWTTEYSHLIDIFLVLFGSGNVAMLELESKKYLKLLDMMKSNAFEQQAGKSVGEWLDINSSFIYLIKFA